MSIITRMQEQLLAADIMSTNKVCAMYQVFEYSLHLREICCILLWMRPCHSALETETLVKRTWVLSSLETVVSRSQHWLFYRAMLCHRRLCRWKVYVCLSTCPSVCPSVWYNAVLCQNVLPFYVIVEIFSPPDIRIILVFEH